MKEQLEGSLLQLSTLFPFIVPNPSHGGDIF